MFLLTVAALAVVTGTLGPSETVKRKTQPVQVNVLPSDARVRVGPGPVSATVPVLGYRLEVRLTPNRASQPDAVSVRLQRGRRPVNGAHVRLTFSMLDMDMGQLTGRLPQTGPGHYARTVPVLGMDGRWALRLDIAPTNAAPFTATILDRMGG